MIHTTIQTKQRNVTQSGGFAMLFTILIVSLILSIAISISNLTLRQAILSNLAKDSQVAFYQADAAAECAMYHDTVMGQFPEGATSGTNQSTDVPDSFQCGDLVVDLQPVTKADYFEYTSTASATPLQQCFSIIFDKSHLNDLVSYSRVVGTGYNICGDNPRRVERSLEVRY